MILKAAIGVFVAAVISSAAVLPQKIGVTIQDWDGKQYNLDSLLDAGIHVVIQQMFSF